MPDYPETKPSAPAASASGSKEAKLAEIQKKINELVKERDRIMSDASK